MAVQRRHTRGIRPCARPRPATDRVVAQASRTCRPCCRRAGQRRAGQRRRQLRHPSDLSRLPRAPARLKPGRGSRGNPAGRSRSRRTSTPHARPPPPLPPLSHRARPHPGRVRLARTFVATAGNDHAPPAGRGLPRNVDLADPGLTSLRPASYHHRRTRHTRYVGESHQDRSAAKPSSSRATDETTGAGEVQAVQTVRELGSGRAGHA